MKNKIFFSLLSILLPLSIWAQEAQWQVNAHAYQYQMTACVVLNEWTDYTNFEVAAFYGEECRGVAEFLPAGDVQVGYLIIYSNKESDEDITFKAYDKNAKKYLAISQDVKIPFVADGKVGSASNPFKIAALYDYNINVTKSSENGTVDPEEKVVRQGNSITVTATPNEGYSFTGWSIDGKVVSEEAAYTFTPTGDVTLTASFAIEKYNLTFKLDDGTILSEQAVEYGAAVIKPTTPYKAGHTFVNWGEEEVVKTMPAHDVTYTAVFEANRHTVTFRYNDQIFKQEELAYGEPIVKPDDPVIAGLVFTSWTPEVLPTMPDRDLTYTAAFGDLFCNVIYKVDGVEDNRVSVKYGTTIPEYNPDERTGYEFSGWSGLPESMTMPANDITVSGSFSKKTYKVTYMVDGEEYKSFDVLYGDKFPAVDDPSKEGHTFAGWDALPSTMPANDVTPNAQFTVNKYRVTFIVEGEAKAETLDYGSEINTPEDPVKEGYTFIGWGSGVEKTVPNHNLTYTAQFTINSHTLTYKVDDEVIVSSSIAYGTAITPLAEPKKTGYTFGGWSEIPATMPDNDVVVTGKFSINKYTLTYMLDGELYGEPEEVVYGTPLILKADPTEREGFVFSGWSLIPETMPADNVTVTGSFTKGAYKLTYIVDGESYKTIAYDFEDAIVPEAQPVKPGYTFSGWSDIPEKMPAGNVEVVGTFTINQYTMTFVLGNGEANVVKTQDYATALEVPTPTKEGYTLTGWDETVPATIPAGDKTFTAQWQINQYTVKFIVDGNDVYSQPQDYNSEIKAPNVSTKIGYTFTGWTPEVDATVPAHDVAYTAVYTINQYSMTFVLGNGEENVVKTQDYASELTAPTPTKEGYTFTGWDNNVPTTVPGTDMAFTAQWQINQYTVKFVADNEIIKEETLDYGAAITAPDAPAKEGYTFSTWGEVAATVPAQDVTYTAVYTVNQYTMTFVLENGEDNVVKTQDYATELTVPSDPSKTGFTFKGWSQDVPATVPAENMTFTAQWERNSYKLTWDVDGTKTESSVLFEGAITKPADPAKEGYTFAGWTPEVAETMPASEVTYTATWTVNQYTMTFVLENGEDNVVKTQDYATELTAPADPSKTGFTFKGWSQDVPATVPAEDMTFTAQWERNSYKLTWDVDGTKTESSVLFEGEITKPADPVKEGYTFAGWTPEVAETMPASDVTYTAQWQINKYKVTFMYGEEVLNTIEVEYGAEIPLPESLDNEGLILVSWIDVPETMPAHDIVIYADFTIDGIGMLRNSENERMRIYDLNGHRIARLQRGINIIRYSDGTTKRVMIK